MVTVESITMEQLKAIKCAFCPLPAVCIGRYDADEGDPDEAGCNECCGHGCEDGYCEQLYDEDGDPTEEGKARAASFLNAIANMASA